jgi:hypothetical protein
MRRGKRIVTLALVRSLHLAGVPGQQPDGWVGQRVMTREGTVLASEGQAPRDPKREEPREGPRPDCGYRPDCC